MTSEQLMSFVSGLMSKAIRALQTLRWSNRKPARPTDLGRSAVRIAYFFIPLPEALPFRDGFTITIYRPPATDEVSSRLEALSQDEADFFKPYLEISASLKLWHASVELPLIAEVNSLFEVARGAFPKGSRRRKQRRPSFSDLAGTIVEVMAPVDGSDDAAISLAFDRGLRHVQELQRAYYARHRVPITLVAREQLPPFIPFAIRTVTRAEDTWPEVVSLFHSNNNFPALERGTPLSRDEEEAIIHALHAQPGRRVFASSLDFHRQAQNALELSGDYAAAVIFAAVAAEALFDDLLAHLLWEEAVRPEAAASYFSGGLATRVRTQFHARIGGSGWDGKREGAVAKWVRNIADVRHRVVHGAYHPTLAEGRAALAAFQGLAEFVSGRLAVPKIIARYPRTAALLVSRERLESSGKWSNKLEALLSDTTETDWVATFTRWKATLSRHRVNAVPLTPDPARSTLIAVIYSPKRIVWVLHDSLAGKASIANAPTDITDAQVKMLEHFMAMLTSASEPISIAFQTAATPATTGEWVDEYRLLPLCGVMVDRSDLA